LSFDKRRLMLASLLCLDPIRLFVAVDRTIRALMFFLENWSLLSQSTSGVIWCELEHHVLEKFSILNKQNALSDALLKSRFQNFVGDAAQPRSVVWEPHFAWLWLLVGVTN